MKDPNALGVIIVNGIPTLNDKPQRSNNSEIYKAIEDDLNFAEQNISQNALQQQEAMLYWSLLLLQEI